MIIEGLELEKSRTIETAGMIGKEMYNKVRYKISASLEKEDDYEQCRAQLDEAIEEQFKIEVERLRERAIKFKNNLP